MRTTVTIDDDVYAKVKQIAEESGRSFGQVISQLTRKSLAAERPRDAESVAPIFKILVGAAIVPGACARNRSAKPPDQDK